MWIHAVDAQPQPHKIVSHLLTFSSIQVGLVEYPGLLQDSTLLDAIERRILDCMSGMEAASLRWSHIPIVCQHLSPVPLAHAWRGARAVVLSLSGSRGRQLESQIC
jgi:hypothetical protein